MEPVGVAAEERGEVGGAGEPRGELAVLGAVAREAAPELLEVALLPHAGAARRLAVRDHAPEPALLGRRRPRRPVRLGRGEGPLRFGSRPGLVAWRRGRVLPRGEPEPEVEVGFEEGEREGEERGRVVVDGEWHGRKYERRRGVEREGGEKGRKAWRGTGIYSARTERASGSRHAVGFRRGASPLVGGFCLRRERYVLKLGICKVWKQRGHIYITSLAHQFNSNLNFYELIFDESYLSSKGAAIFKYLWKWRKTYSYNNKCIRDLIKVILLY